MLNYTNVITEEKSYSGLQMKEIKPVMKLVIRGKKREFLSAIGKSLNLLLPTEPNTSSRSERLSADNLSLLEDVLGSVGSNRFNDLPMADKNSLFLPLITNFITGFISFICKPE